MIHHLTNILPSTNIIRSEDYPIKVYSDHVDMMNIKWWVNSLMRHATIYELGEEK